MAEAFARVNDKASREKMTAFLKTETDSDVKLQIALPLVNDARNKEIIPEVIRLMGEVSTERGWRAAIEFFDDNPEEAVAMGARATEAAVGMVAPSSCFSGPQESISVTSHLDFFIGVMIRFGPPRSRA